jgi:para-aminobenzoate synthetase component 1
MAFFLDSSLREGELARYSFLGSDPIGWFRSRGNRSAFACPWGEEATRGPPIDVLRTFLSLLPSAAVGRPPYPFLGGLVGFFAYDLGRSLEAFPDTKGEDLGVPDIHLALYSRVIVVDHVWGEAFSIAMAEPPRYELPPIPNDVMIADPVVPIPPLSRDAYIETIEAAKEAIREGEIFQVNLSHRQHLRLAGSPELAYERLRTRTPSAFGAYVDVGDHRILSASPERFLRVRGREVETRPIKGTRPRGRTSAEDETLARELLASEKDAAENVMIVDLERNDLGRVCEFGSVRVPVLRALRRLPNVHHLESVVVGRLREDVAFPDLLAATFPGGSITGAPKPRAMEIIERLEPHRRGVYTGAIGYISWNGSVDLNIAIRTATVLGADAYFAVGGGIVADSDPEAEYRETLDKFRGHAEALTAGRLEVTSDGLRVA